MDCKHVGADLFLTPESSQREPARPLTHLDTRLQRGGYSAWRSGAAPFPVTAPETSSVSQLLSAACACPVRVHAGHVDPLRL